MFMERRAFHRRGLPESLGWQYNTPMSTEPDYNSLDPEERSNKIFALFSIGLGILSLCLALIPGCGMVGSLAGIGFGYFGLRSESRTMARIGIAVIALVIVIVYSLLLLFRK
jgi:hypothetical protein